MNNAYLKRGGLQAHRLEGWWTDAGTFESLLRQVNLVAGGANKPRVERLIMIQRLTDY